MGRPGHGPEAEADATGHRARARHDARSRTGQRVPVEMTFGQVGRFRDGEPVQMGSTNPERGRRAAEAEA